MKPKNLLISLLLVTSAFAARNPMGYWYEWKEVTEKNPAVAEIALSWEDNTYWRIDIILDTTSITNDRLLMFNTGITHEMCEKAAFPMVLVMSYSEMSWRGICPAYGDGFAADSAAKSNDDSIAPAFNEDTGTYLIWLPYNRP